MAKDRPGSILSTDLPNEAVSFDVDAFDEAIRAHGVTFTHWRAMRCPVGMIDQHDTRRPHEDHSGCSNGFIYTKAGEITCLFLGNGKSSTQTELGLHDGSTVQVTLPRHYDQTTEPVFIAPYDRLYLGEERITVVNWQLFEHHIAGKEKLNFPVVVVQDLVDNQGKSYGGADFTVQGGQVTWLTSNRPGLDPENGKGRVCAIRYTYRPYWYVKQLIHEVRVSQSENAITGERQVQRMPQAIVLQREYIFEKDEKDDQAKDPSNPRQVKGPAQGLFGPR